MEQLLRHTPSTDWVTAVLVVSLLLLAVAKWQNNLRFSEFLQLLVTDKYFSMQGKDVRFFSGFNLLLLLFQSLTFGLLLFLLFHTFFPETIRKLSYPYAIIAGGYLLFTLAKAGLEKGIGYLFSIDKLIDLYVYQKNSYRSWIALIVCLGNVLLIYSFPHNRFLLVGVLCLVLLLNLIFIGYLIKKQEKQLMPHLFYFILYLCALEISPYIILYKTVLH